MIHSQQLRWMGTAGWSEVETSASFIPPADLVLLFGGCESILARQPYEEISRRFPGAVVAGCSTAGDILGTEVSDDGLVATALAFETTRVAMVAEEGADPAGSAAVGARLAARLADTDLVHAVVFADGTRVNGSELARGLESGLPRGVAITGGLAGDGTRFRETLVRWADRASQGVVVALGFYGRDLRVGYGSLGGWDPFGPERRITRSRGNVLFELDSRPALELYRLYLGEQSAGLPATGLLFPLSLRSEEGGPGRVRTIVGVDEREGSLTFVGDVPEGQIARLMRANLDRLIDGAAGAATTTLGGLEGHAAQAALLISCVGRRMVLNQRIEEEVENVRQVLGPTPALTGFYSYGEIGPNRPQARCELHNQTMTITAFAEI